MTMRQSDFTPIIDLVAEPGTGPVRERRPVYVDLLPPCNHACPAGEDIQAWLAHAQAGRYHEAWLTLTRDNPLPAVHGRVCYHPCETSCNRQQVDSAVSIHAVERFLGDQAAKEGWQLPIPLLHRKICHFCFTSKKFDTLGVLRQSRASGGEACRFRDYEPQQFSAAKRKTRP